MVRNILFLGIVIALLATSATASDLVMNGGFTTGDFTDWNNNNTSWFIGGDFTDPGAPTDTVYAAGTACRVALCNDPTTGAWISQPLVTVTSQSYALTFYYDAGIGSGLGDGGTTELDAYWNGSSTPVDTISDATASTWSEYTVTGLTATSNSTVLEFTGQTVPGELFLTDISVTASSTTPEPASLLLIGAGLLGTCTIGPMLRRRRKARRVSRVGVACLRTPPRTAPN